MLSYRHAFHAGNHADVLKHLTQVLILQSLLRKDKPFFYLDTHAGAGLYDLRSESAEKTGEYIGGIVKVLNKPSPPEVVKSYLGLIREMNPQGFDAEKLRHYPGSPWVSQCLMRKQDRSELFELHPSDSQILRSNMREARRDVRGRINIHQENGFHQLKAALPPIEKRGLILIDPPYEVKTDYETVVKAVQQGYKRFATGIYAIWYPVVQRKRIDLLEQQLKDSGIKNVLQIEMSVRPDSEELGMTGSGMIVVNPPWQLLEDLKSALPWLLDCLGLDKGASWRINTLVDE